MEVADAKWWSPDALSGEPIAAISSQTSLDADVYSSAQAFPPKFAHCFYAKRRAPTRLSKGRFAFT